MGGSYLWIEVPGGAVATLVLLGMVWKVLRVAFRVDAALPTLLAIADEFQPNGGGSLRDSMDRIEKEQHTVRQELVTHTQQDAENFESLRRAIVANGNLPT